MLAATILFSMSDTMAKYVTQSIPAIELAAIRYCVFVAMAFSPLLRHRHNSLRSRRPALQIVRGLGVAGSAVSFILALGKMPIADATAINFVTPLMITVFAIPVLGEVVRPQGWAAVTLGFLGMLVVVRPGIGGLHAPALLVLLSSACWCMAMLVTRRLVGVDSSGVTLVWTAVSGLMMILLALPFFLAPITWRAAALAVLVGVVASSAQWLAVLAYRHARASALAPLSYAQLVWSSALGVLVFGARPDVWTLVGAMIIAASGLYVVHLERARMAASRAGPSLLRPGTASG